VAPLVFTKWKQGFRGYGFPARDTTAILAGEPKGSQEITMATTAAVTVSDAAAAGMGENNDNCGSSGEPFI
jgi:hypothetical protein